MIELARRVRVQFDGDAMSELLERMQPGSVTELAEAVFPQGGMSPKSFNWLCDHFDLWRDLQPLSVRS